MNVLRILSRFGCILAIAAGLSVRAEAAVLTIQQTAQYAYNAGFRGGSLVSAIAAAEAESGFDTEAVNNNLHQTTPGGQLLPGADGRPVLLSMPRSGKQMLPLDSIQALGDGRYGRVVGYCRGLWQFNSNVFRPALPDAGTFDPVRAAATAWHISRHGRDWGKWVVFQNGTGWEPARMARARAAARAIDLSVLTGTGNERAQARVTGGAIRQTAGGARIRALHAGDTGRVLAGPVKAAITQGPQTSYKLWWQVAWDSGPTGWVSEDLLIRSSTTGVQPPAKAFNGYPHNLVGIATNTTLSWESGANAATQKLYFGTSATLTVSDLKYTGLAEAWAPPASLQPFTNYYWRVDSISAQGAVTAGSVWQFLTKPALPPALTLTSVTASSSVLQPGFPFVVTYKTLSAASQPVLVDASLHRTGSNPIMDLPNVVSRLVPAGAGTMTRNFNLPLSTTAGAYTLYVRLVQDYNGNGAIDAFETVIADMRVPVTVATPGPLVDRLAVSPAVVAPSQPVTITASITALPGQTLTALRLYRAEGQSGPGAWTQVQTRTLSNVGSYQASFVDYPPTIRRHWYVLQASDSAGQAAPAGHQFQPVSVIVTINDSQPPVITWNSPADGAVISTNGNFTGTATDNDRIESSFYRLDDGEWKYLSMISNDWYISPSGEAGPHQVTIRITDRSGNTVEQSRMYYRAPVAGGTDFDEDQLFTGSSDHNPHWQLSLTGNAQITGGRIDAPDEGDSGNFSRMKMMPSWAKSAEVSYQCGPTGSSFSWNRNGFGPIVVRVIPGGPGPWQLQSGPQSNPLTIPLSLFTANASTRLSVLVRVSGVQWYCRVVLVGAVPVTLAESLQTISNLTVFPLELATFQTGASAQMGPLGGGPGWLDDVSFRAFRAFQSFDCRDLRPLPLTATERPFTVNWGSVPGRFYQLETRNSGSGQWTALGSVVPAAGILTSQSLNFPRSRPSAMVRVRQVQP